MTVDEFWKLVGHIDCAQLQQGEGHDEAAVRPLVGALAALDKPELESFEEHLARTLYDLDGRQYLEAAGDSGSDDSFLYARCFVVAMGQDVYERTLRDPTLMPKTLDQWCEPLLYAARNAWRQRAGQDLEYETKVSFETGSNTALW